MRSTGGDPGGLRARHQQRCGCRRRRPRALPARCTCRRRRGALRRWSSNSKTALREAARLRAALLNAWRPGRRRSARMARASPSSTSKRSAASCSARQLRSAAPCAPSRASSTATTSPASNDYLIRLLAYRRRRGRRRPRALSHRRADAPCHGGGAVELDAGAAHGRVARRRRRLPLSAPRRLARIKTSRRVRRDRSRRTAPRPSSSAPRGRTAATLRRSPCRCSRIGSQSFEQRQHLVGAQAARLRRAGAGGEGGVEAIDVEADVERRLAVRAAMRRRRSSSTG